MLDRLNIMFDYCSLDTKLVLEYAYKSKWTRCVGVNFYIMVKWLRVLDSWLSQLGLLLL